MPEGTQTPEQGTKIEISRFTKSTEEGRRARGETAAQIRGERAERFQAKKSIPKLETGMQSATDRITSLIVSNEENAQALAEESAKLEQLAAERAKRSNSLTNRILYGISNLVSPPKLEEQTQAAQAKFAQLRQGVQQARIEQEQLEAQSTIQKELLRQTQERAAIDRSRAMLQEFYKKQAVRLQAFREVQKAEEIRRRFSDLGYVASRYQVYFICGIRPSVRGGGLNNPNLTEDTNWQSKLDILLGYGLDLSTSTVREGDGTESMISRIGVILRKGEIEAAYEGDRGTVAAGTGKKVAGSAIKMTDPQKNISDSIYARYNTSSPWNEFIVGGDVQFAGLYVCFGRKPIDQSLEMASGVAGRRDQYDDRVTPQRIAEAIAVVQAVDIPLYVIEDGVVYEAEYGMGSGVGYIRKKGEPISPEKILDSDFRLSTESLESARSRTVRYLKVKLPPKPEEQDTARIVYQPPQEAVDMSEKLRSLVNEPSYDPGRLVQVFKERSDIAKLYASDAGVWEGYTIEQHTLMVMRQFERYFSRNFNSPLISSDHFRVMLALHDIGKPIARRPKIDQGHHIDTHQAIEKILLPLGFTWRQIDIITAVATQDIIGQLIRHNSRVTLDQAVNDIRYRAHQLRVNPRDLANLFLTHYLCDAGSYTRDAGGKQGLDALFDFSQDEAGRPTIQIAQSQVFARQKIADLFRRLEV